MTLSPAIVGALMATTIAAATSGTPLARPQSASSVAALPAFEAASIKPSNGDLSGRPNSSTILTSLPGRLVITNMTLRGMIRNAYGMNIPAPGDVTGGPGWLDDDRWDVQATVDGDQSPDRKLLMLRRLLAERLQVVLRHGQRDVASYALVLDRADGRLGPRLKPAGECAPRNPGEPQAPAPPGALRRCGGRGGPGRISAAGVTMQGLAGMLTTSAGQPVTDRTGLTGTYDLDLEWTREEALVTALKEQLGLRLEEGERRQQATIVVESAQRPIPD